MSMGVFSVFSTKRFVIAFFTEIAVFLLAGFLFSNLMNRSLKMLSTWSKCESSYVAYDSRVFDSNCYRYYGNRVSVNLSKGDSIRLKCDCYQFIKGVRYDRKSLLNDKITILGKFKVLDPNEIAIPYCISREYKLNEGDKVYINGSDEYSITYIFNDVSNIKTPLIGSDENVVFLGDTVKPLHNDYSYAVFDTVSKDYNHVYLFSKSLFPVQRDLAFTASAMSVLFLVAETIVNFFFKKAERQQVYKAAVSGSRKRYFIAIYGFNFLLLLLPAGLAAIVLLCVRNWLAGLLLFCLTSLVYLTKTTYLRVSIN